MSHVSLRRWVMSHVIESCQTQGWFVPFSWMSHATHMNESYHTHEWVMPHTWMSHATHKNESFLTHERVMPHTWMSHATHMNESCHTHEESGHTHEWVECTCNEHIRARALPSKHIITHFSFLWRWNFNPPQNCSRIGIRRLDWPLLEFGKMTLFSTFGWFYWCFVKRVGLSL